MFNKPEDAPDEFIHRMFDDGAPVAIPAPVDLEYYVSLTGQRCYRARGTSAEVRHENRLNLLAAARRHEQSLREEAEARKPRASRVIFSSGPREEPDELADVRRDDPDQQYEDVQA